MSISREPTVLSDLPSEPHPDGPTDAWHALDIDEVRRRLETDPGGLSAKDVEARLVRFGPNELKEEPPPSPLVVLLRQFASPLIYILVAAAVVTLLLGKYVDTAVIGVVLALNAGIGFVQERKAEGAVRALMGLVVPHARVVRGGQEWEIDSRELVPGDVVLLEPGSRVPADLRLEIANAMQVDESLLTGESVPVTKRTDPVGESTGLADRVGMAFTGSVVTTGRGRGLVVSTGDRTELGAIAGLIRGEVQERTPLQRRMDHFAEVVGIAVGIAAVVAFVSGVALGDPASDMLLTAVALAVAAIPEGLPVAFTITLARGVHRMAQRQAIIRRLPAVETLGSTTVIGSDKTGTLTQNRMTVQAVWSAGTVFERRGSGRDEGFTPISADATSGTEHAVGTDQAAGTDHAALRRTLLAGVLTNEAEAYLTDHGIEVLGDPTEAALLVAGLAAGIAPEETREAHPLVAEIPFEPERRYSAAICVDGDDHVVFAKGAPERIIEMCVSQRTTDGVGPLDAGAVRTAAADLAGRGLRVLAMAERRLPERLERPDAFAEPDGLVFLGLQGMMDPPREGVRDAIAVCHDAGIRVVMITGDHGDTARAIAEDLGITDGSGEVLTGEQIAQLDDDELAEQVTRVSVFARAAPADKLRIVRAMQARDEVVAVTGDGVNDAPALKAAAIGIAMGESGTDVAREASDMVLADDNFVSIASAVEEGRVTFDNVRKVTFFLVSTGAATIVAIVMSVWLRWPLLLLPAQLLWLNLVTNGVQDVALAFEPAEKDVLRRRPRGRREGVLSRLLWERAVLVGIVLAAATLLVFRWELDATDSIDKARTVALSTMVVAMAFHVGSARSETESVFRRSPFSNPLLSAATAVAVSLHVAALYLPPTQFVLQVEPIEAEAWLRVVLAALPVLVVVEMEKLVRRRLGRRSAATEAEKAPRSRTRRQ
ncbi:MAG: cation-translocating P-type ATPase [Acidimicrobiales bacterium]